MNGRRGRRPRLVARMNVLGKCGMEWLDEAERHWLRRRENGGKKPGMGLRTEEGHEAVTGTRKARVRLRMEQEKAHLAHATPWAAEPNNC